MTHLWQRHKAIVLENDDWCGQGVVGLGYPGVYERACAVSEIRAVLDYRDGSLRPWSTARMETPEEMQRLFDLLLRFKGADGHPAIFTPICLVASPDFNAIRENRFEAYMDIPIAKGFPQGLDSQKVLAKAKEGIELGVWYPQSHGRAHHYNGRKWVRALREKRDKTLLLFFEFGVIGMPTPPWGENLNELKGLEFDDMSDAELDDWFQAGMRFFREAFGYETPAMPITDARPENLEQCKGMLAHSGVKIASHTRNTFNTVGTPECPMGKEDPPGVLCLGWTAYLDPRGKRDEGCPAGCSAAYERIVKSWACGMPAIVGGHRINYCSYDANQVKEGYSQTERLLARIAKEHPDAVYLTSTEVGPLYRTGTSVLRQGSRTTCRNYNEGETIIELSKPPTASKCIARNLRTDQEIVCERDGEKIRFSAPEGEYAIEAG